MATFAEDAYINDAEREIRGVDAIRRFVAKEIAGDNVTMEVTEVIDHHGDMIVRANLVTPKNAERYWTIAQHS